MNPPVVPHSELNASLRMIAVFVAMTFPLLVSGGEPVAEPVYYHSPAWSPDGGRIAFYSNRDGGFDIYTITIDGNELRRLTRSAADEAEVGWSPDGERLVFARKVGKHYRLYIMNADGSGSVPLPDAMPALSPKWTASGIFFECRVDGNNDICRTSPAAGKIARLTSDAANDFGPAPSPDGKRVAFFSSRSGNYQIYIMNADGAGVRAVTAGENHHVKPAWSPDGRYLLFSRVGEGAGLHRLNIETGEQLHLAVNARGDGAASWSPDSKRIAYLVDTEEGMAIRIVGADGGESRQLMPAVPAIRSE